MKRKVFLSFFNFDEHIDLSFLDKSKTTSKLFKKGELRSNGKTVQLYNDADIYFTGNLDSEEYDKYDSRIQAMIDAVGGEEVIKRLVSEYKAETISIILDIPTSEDEGELDGFFSLDIMKKLVDLNIDIHLRYMY